MTAPVVAGPNRDRHGDCLGRTWAAAAKAGVNRELHGDRLGGTVSALTPTKVEP